jgi:chorismate mutase
MTSQLRDQIREIDRAIVALISERARLLAGRPMDAALEDLLLRYRGPLSPASIRELLETLARLCAESRREDA